MERFLSLLLSAAQRSKWGLLFIVVGSIWLLGMLIVGLISTAGNVILVANGTKPVLQFLGSGLGILVTAIVSIVLVFIGLGILWFLRPQPEAKTAQAEALESESPAPQRSGPGPTNAASPQADSQEVEQLRTKLSQAEQEIEELRIELNNRPPRHFGVPAGTALSVTPNDVNEIEAENKTLNTEIEELKAQLAEAQQTIRSQRKAMEDEQGHVHWGNSEGGVNLSAQLANAEAKREIEKLRAENERLKEQPDDELRRRCSELAENLSIFLERREKFRDAGAETDIVFGDHRSWSHQTMADYRDKFERELAGLLDNLEQSGRLTAEQRAHFRVPTDDPQTIREVAARLSGMCRQD